MKVPIEREVVFTFSYETWDDAVQRGMMRPPDRLAAALIADPEVQDVVIANPYRWLPALCLRRLLTRPAAFPRISGRHLLQPWLLRSHRDPIDLEAIEVRYRSYGAALGRGARRHGLTQPVLLTTHPLVAAFADTGWAHRVMYFGRDDWTSYPGRSALWPVYREAYRRIAASGMPVAAVSAQIIDRIGPTGPGIVVPNGVEVSEWSGPQPVAPSWFSRLGGPRLVYVGTIDDRLDVEGIAMLARARPDVTVVLLGHVADPGHLVPLREITNVVVHPAVGRAELVAVLRNAEVALVAHRVTALTEAMSPLKAYEYLAGGAPVLSVDLPPMRGLDERVILVSRVADFVGVIDRALALGRADDESRMRFMRENSWESRHRRVFDLLYDRINVSG